MKMIIQLLLASCLAVGCLAQQPAQDETIPDQTIDDIAEAAVDPVLESYFDAIPAPEVIPSERTEGTEMIPLVPSQSVEDTAAADSPQDTRQGRGRGGYGRRGHHGRGHRGHRGHSSGNWTSEQKMDHICGALQGPGVSRKERWMAAKLARLAPATRERFTALLAARKTEMLQCCNQTGSERILCVDTMNRQRYDRVCAGEEPMCIWSVIKGTEIRSSDTVTSCCASTGEPRYDCFDAARRSYRGRHGRRRI